MDGTYFLESNYARQCEGVELSAVLDVLAAKIDVAVTERRRLEGNYSVYSVVIHYQDNTSVEASPDPKDHETLAHRTILIQGIVTDRRLGVNTRAIAELIVFLNNISRYEFDELVEKYFNKNQTLKKITYNRLESIHTDAKEAAFLLSHITYHNKALQKAIKTMPTPIRFTEWLAAYDGMGL